MQEVSNLYIMYPLTTMDPSQNPRNFVKDVEVVKAHYYIDLY